MIDKKIIHNLIKHYKYYQKYRESSNYFKFTLKKDTNFNYLILIDIIYIDNNLILYIINEITRF